MIKVDLMSTAASLCEEYVDLSLHHHQQGLQAASAQKIQIIITENVNSRS